MLRALLAQGLVFLCCLLAGAVSAQEPADGHVALIEIDGPIGPATSAYYEKSSEQAVARGAALIVLRIDTPGGLDTAMRDIVKAILASPIPVVGYVAPGGARAASAGTYILYASHVAAMAPATNLGAATPVPAMGGGFGDGEEEPARAPDTPEVDGEDAEKTQGDEKAGDEKAEEPEDRGAPKPAPKSAMEKKVVNDAVAYIRGLAERRGRNADWAEKAVREGVSLQSSAALEQGVIDLIAADIDELLAKVDGREVETRGGITTIASKDALTERYEPGWRFELLSVLTNPTVAYILMMIGIYGLLLEGYSPGAIVPGVLGAICLLLALFAFQVLPVNYVGLGLIILGVVLMIAEALAPSFGVLGFGGIAAFIFGSIMLMDTDVPGYGINLGVIFGLSAAGAGVMALTLYMLWRSRQAIVTTGEPLLVGHELDVLNFENGQGWGRINGERWRIVSGTALQPGQRARVTHVDGLTLTVEPLA